MPTSASRHYDYVVLHATANAIEFYESMGFVRVGAITQVISENMEEEDGKSLKPLPQSEIVSSPVITYFTKKSDETPMDVAKAFNVDVWDLIYLNHFMYPSIEPKSYLIRKTKLFIPKKGHSEEQEGNVQWYFAKEDETPKTISLKFKVSCQDIIDANRTRMPDLFPNSRLIKGYVN